MTDAHIGKVWVAIIVLTLISLVVPPAFVLVTILFGYLGLIFIAGILKICADHIQRPRRHPAPVRLSAKDAADFARAAAKDAAVSPEGSANWRTTWNALCDSPAEMAFLDAAIDSFGLLPQNRVLAGGGITLDLQALISFMRVDFLINSQIVVEVDGAAYHSSAEHKKNDTLRDTELVRLGYMVVRIPAKRVFQRPAEAIQDLRAALVASGARPYA